MNLPPPATRFIGLGFKGLGFRDIDPITYFPFGGELLGGGKGGSGFVIRG